MFSSIGLNVILMITQTVVKWSILLVEGIAFSVLNGGQGALSVSQASSSGTTSSVSTWACESVINRSGKGSTTDAGNILSIGKLHVAIVVATIIPVQAVLWWKLDMACPLGTNWEASGELAVVADRCASFDCAI
jgi:hypothetical protein